jgi:hypothetical protein
LISKTFAWRVMIAVCIASQMPVQASAAQQRAETRAAALPKKKATTAPQPKTPARNALRKKHRGHKPARRPNVMYRWSDEQLMSGGVNPASIGKKADAVRTSGK